MSIMVAYDKENGAIHWVRSGGNYADSWRAKVEELYGTLETGERIRPSDYYVETGDKVLAPKKHIEPSIDIRQGECDLWNLPEGTTVSVLGFSEQGSAVALEFDEPGTYTIELRCAPQYYDKEIEVEIP